jgi:hypothetical protein
MQIISFNTFMHQCYVVGLCPNSAIFKNMLCGKEMNNKLSAYFQRTRIQWQCGKAMFSKHVLKEKQCVTIWTSSDIVAWTNHQ